MHGKWRGSLQTGVQVCRGANVNSDHYLVTVTIKLKLRKVEQQNQYRKQLDIAKLKCPKTNREFVLELRNRFSALANSNEPG